MPAAEDPKTVAADIARQLDETNPDAVIQIERLIHHLGAESKDACLQETLAIEAQSGMLTSNKKRWRTPGGVFFYLVRGRTPVELQRIIWPTHTPAGEKRPKRPKRPRQTSVFPWAERLTMLAELIAKPGEGAVKITVVGRPNKTIERGDVVILTVASGNLPTLPKGLPTPPAEPTVYVVYIAQKQWRKVAEAIQRPEDKLIAEGYPFIDKKLGVVGVLAQSVTTAALQRSRLEAQE
jgi:hypothetical protein